MLGKVIVVAALICLAQPTLPLTPIRLKAGTNPVSNIAGDGVPGIITLNWRGNGNSWGHDIYTVTVGGSIATVEGDNSLMDTPHLGDDMVTSVRFGRGPYANKVTTFALVAHREWERIGPAPDPAPTTIRVYVLVRNESGVGTSYEFKKIRQFETQRFYCNADMALKSELQFPLSGSYSGTIASDGC